MNYNISNTDRWQIYPFLLPVFEVVHNCVYFFGSVDPGTAFRYLFLYTAGAGILFILSRWLLKSGLKAGLLTFGAGLLFFYWDRFQSTVKAWLPHGFFTRMPVLLVLLLLLMYLLYHAVLRSSPVLRGRIIRFLNLLFIIYLLTDIVQWALYAGKTRPSSPFAQQVLPQPVPGTPKWDVYLLLVDEYTGSKGLKETLHFDNSSMDSFLMHRGFSVQYDSRANYNLTLVSMASLLNMDYLTTANTHMSHRDFTDCKRWIQYNKVFDWFRKNGYNCYNYSFFDIQGTARSPYRQFPFAKPPGWFMTHGTLYDVIPHIYWPILFPEKQHRQAIQSIRNETDSLALYHRAIMEGINRLATQKNGGNSFIYAHFLTTHTPFIYDDEGKTAPPDTILKAAAYYETAAYLRAVKATNTILQTAIDSILTHAGDRSVILLLSDHGFRSEEPGLPPELKFRNLNAVYFPDRDYSLLQPQMSNVNVFRIVMQKLSGASMPLLQDSCIDLKLKLEH